MRPFHDKSIKFKLRFIIITTIIFALFLVFSGFMIFESIRFKNALINELEVHTEIAAKRTTAAIAFDDATSAYETLIALSSIKSIVTAVIFNPEGEIFTKYNKENAVVTIPELPDLNWEKSSASFTQGDKLHVFHTVILDNTIIGTLYIQSDLNEMHQILTNYAGMAAIFVFISVLIAYYLSLHLQEGITKPIEHLVNTAKTVSEKKDYSIRAEKMGSDELGTLIDNFNGMLDQIQNRDSELIDAAIEQARLVTAIEQAKETIMLIDVKGKIQYINPAAENFTGLTTDKIVGKNIFALKRTPEEQKAFNNLWETISKDKTWSGHLSKEKNDGTATELDITVSPIRNSSGKVISFVSIGRDISKEMELEDRLRQSQKMEAIGTLAGGIAHDFNNILGAIIGYTEIAQDDIPGNNPALKSLDQILRSSFRAKDLVTQILAFSRKSTHENKHIDISLALHDTIKLLRATIPSTIEIKTNISSERSLIMADATQISQVFLNLCTNAAQAMVKTGGILSIDTSSVTLVNKDHDYPEELLPGQYVKIQISDTGEGIDPKIKTRIFEPFFTTKEQGKGTGMGLAVAHGIINSHKGIITLESELHKGSIFTILLPELAGQAHSINRRPKPVKDIQTGREKILFVDDEPLLLDLGKKVLESLSYNVTEMNNSIEALELFQRDPEKFDLVITDQTMPKMTGHELAKKLIEIRPDIPIILCTGYSQTVSPEVAYATGIKEYLEKPVSKKNFAEAIRSVLDSNVSPT